jgi:glutamate synthase (NADPH/NADH) large chain
MSGGVAFVYDPSGTLADRCNHDLVNVEAIASDDDLDTLTQLVTAHHALTGSALAGRLLQDWPATLKHFVLVIPREFKARRLGASAGNARLSA